MIGSRSALQHKQEFHTEIPACTAKFIGGVKKGSWQDASCRVGMPKLNRLSEQSHWSLASG
jgi:hypothetical protein